MNKNNTNKPDKFILLSRYRSGTNLLKSGIEQHPEIKMLPELFNHVFIVSDPEKYFDKNIIHDIFSADEDHIKSIGLKLMYEQATESELDEDYFAPHKGDHDIRLINDWLKLKGLSKNVFEHIWESLKNDTSIKVLHVIRTNQLHSYVSFLLAIREGKWIGDKYETVDEGVFIDKNRLEDWFRKGNEHYCHFRNYFKEHEMMEIFYEDLSSNFTGSMEKVFDFLGYICDSQVTPGISKQNNHKIPEIIINYEELKNHFKNSKWSDFFNEAYSS